MYDYDPVDEEDLLHNPPVDVGVGRVCSEGGSLGLCHCGGKAVEDHGVGQRWRPVRVPGETEAHGAEKEESWEAWREWKWTLGGFVKVFMVLG